MTRRQADFGANRREPCREHLSRFAERFILPEFRHRWIHILCERPDKALKELHKFERHLDPGVCRLLEVKGDGELTDRYGGRLGIYFDGKEPAQQLSFSDALERMRPYQDDGLISFEPGVSALFFHHDLQVWSCEAPTQRLARK